MSQIVSKAFEALRDLDASSKEVENIIELMPNIAQKQHFIKLRDQNRRYDLLNVIPLWKRLAVATHTTNVSDTPDPTASSVIADQLANKLSEVIYHAILLDKQLIYEMSLVFDVRDNMSHPMSGILDYFSSATPTPIQHSVPDMVERGTTALQYFHDRASTYPTYNLSFNELINAMTKKISTFLEGFGGAIYDIMDSGVGYDEGRLQNTMEKLADQGQGLIPENWNTFFSAVGQSASNPDWWTNIKFTAGYSVSDIAHEVVDVGTRAISAGENILEGASGVGEMLKYAPYILLAAGALYVFTLGGGPAKLFKGGLSKLKSRAT